MELLFDSHPCGINPAITLLKHVVKQALVNRDLRDQLGLSAKDVLAADQFKADLVLAYVTAEANKDRSSAISRIA